MLPVMYLVFTSTTEGDVTFYASRTLRVSNTIFILFTFTIAIKRNQWDINNSFCRIHWFAFSVLIIFSEIRNVNGIDLKIIHWMIGSEEIGTHWNIKCIWFNVVSCYVDFDYNNRSFILFQWISSAVWYFGCVRSPSFLTGILVDIEYAAIHPSATF